ncbi:MAG: hypothetical protein ACYTE8_04155 [Planctomycetota bacterium]|jgi:hypothetical protein
MKDMLKNPILYYILVPVFVGLWPLLVGTVYLPKAENNWTDLKDKYLEAAVVIQEILKLDRDRLEFTSSAGEGERFDYATAIKNVASEHGIPDSQYNFNSGVLITTREQTTQNARISLNEVDVVKFTQFLSTLQLRPGIQCTGIKMTKKKSSPDSWDVDLEFKYYF